MTVARPEDADLEFETGLGDFDTDDAVVPRLTIDHKVQEFKDSLSGERFPIVDAILLGLVKQRALWHTSVDDGDWPMCRSMNHVTGFPNMSDKQPKEKLFPWALSGFRPDDFPPDDNGLVRLPCKGCALKEWKSHPDGKKPYCSEQFTMPLLYSAPDTTNFVPAILTFQKTSLKPIKAYLTAFARSGAPVFGVITRIGLDVQKKGTTEYGVPNFRTIGESDQNQWRSYATSFRSMRDFLTADPGDREETEDATVPASAVVTEDPPADAKVEPGEPAKTSETGGSAAPAEPKPEPAVAPATPAASSDAPADDDDDLPF